MNWRQDWGYSWIWWWNCGESCSCGAYKGTRKGNLPETNLIKFNWFFREENPGIYEGTMGSSVGGIGIWKRYSKKTYRSEKGRTKISEGAVRKRSIVNGSNEVIYSPVKNVINEG